MKHLLLYLLLCCAAYLAAQSEPAYAGGLLEEDERYDLLPRMAPEDGAKAVLPVSVDWSAYCPEVRHQGYIFSCVGWATGYAALSIQRAMLNQCTDRALITRNAHSALFLYNQIKTGDCTQGARISDALRLLQQKGNCLAGQFDFDVNNCEQQPDERTVETARRFSISDYMTLFGQNEDPAMKTALTKRVLAAGKPVVVGMNVLRNFYQLQNALYWHPELGNTAPAGGHAMVVTGYDDRKGAFRLMNSWGQNWGDKGFIWIKYNDFGRFCKYAYVMRLAAEEMPEMTENQLEAPNVRPLQRLSGKLEFRSLEGWQPQSGAPVFETQAVQRQGFVYQLRREDWQTGQLFQLILQDMPADQYLYVFSVDARNEVHFHWPRSEVLDARFEGRNESGLLICKDSEVAIPGPQKALKLAHAGTDRLVVLFSQKKIETIDTFAKIVGQQAGDLAANIRATLGAYAVPAADIIYSDDQISFHAATRAEGFIVPVVLEVKAR